MSCGVRYVDNAKTQVRKFVIRTISTVPHFAVTSTFHMFVWYSHPVVQQGVVFMLPFWLAFWSVLPEIFGSFMQGVVGCFLHSHIAKDRRDLSDRSTSLRQTLHFIIWNFLVFGAINSILAHSDLRRPGFTTQYHYQESVTF